jgi:tRNA-specific 2-thiouridylase
LDGEAVGRHQGAHFFTIGQRKGLAVGGTTEPLFVIDTDVDKNIVYVGQGKEHPGLFRKALKVISDEIHWVRNDLKIPCGVKLEVKARIRYRQPLQNATLIQQKEALYVVFEQHQSAITSGQFVAWYQNEELVGSGVIS